MYILSLIQFSDPDYLAFIESLKEASEPPPSIETHLEEIEAKKCKIWVNMVVSTIIYCNNNFYSKSGS